MATKKFDYGLMARLEKKLKGVKKYKAAIKSATGKSITQKTERVTKKLKTLTRNEDDLQVKHSLAMEKRNKYGTKEAGPFEKELDRTLRFTFKKGDPRLKDFDL